MLEVALKKKKRASLSPVKRMLEVVLKRKRSVSLTCKAMLEVVLKRKRSVPLTCKADVGGSAKEETKRLSHL